MKNKTEKIQMNIGKKIFKGFRNITIFFITVILLISISGLIYERIGLYSDSKKYSVPGTIVKVNGHDMHVYSEGKGNSTVVFVSGFGTPSPYADFYPLYNEISKYTRTVVYERPGYGYSEVSNTSRDIDTITKEMHQLLEKSGEKAPYILVGHSMGSLEIIRFAQRYKNEVKGIVMIDGGSPEFYANEEIDQNRISSMKLKSVLKNEGIIRLLFNYSKKFYNSTYSFRNQLSLVPLDLKNVDTAMYLKTITNKNKTAELVNLKSNAQIVMKNGNLGQIPLRILTSGEEAKDSKWKNSQEDFKSWSTDSKQKIVKGSPHYIHQYEPNVINNEIKKLIENQK
ncbi:alpha/beta hydrolase [Clostridium estertheticum]|uniref:alpha/beta hydrolase n=1 Tax=Clostridium estertheticum TaxID=238834 RepID=UPI001C0DCFA3|nr:alpha/beta hydrolase [Clostridium estertheticum]MBU3171761.1 alpha/beta hydrolase [Clostridium estertheticum]MBX4265675.1 alpha/beta hydrolase [Clostridium estertheticum]WLC90987.1 alpha/beta hydrolase [Clostridium estertheticum]